MAGDNADIVIRVRSDGIATADSQLKQLMQTGIRVETVTKDVERGFKKASDEGKRLGATMTAINTIASVTTLAAYAGAVTHLADQWTVLTNKLANANFEQERMVDVQNRVFEIAQRTRTGLDATSTLYARMVRSLQQYNITALQSGQLTEIINKAMIVSGATTAESTAAIIQFSQALQSGVLRGDEFRSVMEQAPRLGKMIADGLGVGTGGLRALANQGKLTADVVINSIAKAGATIDEEFNRTIPTLAQNFEIATNNAIKFVGTSASVTSGVSLLGSGVVALSENLDTLSTVAVVLATSLAGNMLSAIGRSAAASTQMNIIAAESSAANIKLVSTLTASSAARYQAAQATLAQVAAERQAIQTAFAADQQYYKGISTLSALLQNTGHVRAATEAVAVAQGAMATRMAVATTASRVLTVSIGALNTVMTTLGGPVGVILLAASAWYMYSQNAKQADTDARNLASSHEELTERLKRLTVVQQEALAVQLQRASVNLAEQVQREQEAVNELTQRYDNIQRTIERTAQSSWVYKSAVEDLSKVQGDLKIATAELELVTQKKTETDQNLAFVQRNLAAATNGATDAIVLQNGVMTISAQVAQNRSETLVKALQAQNNEYQIAQYKLDGNKKAAAQLADAQNRLGKVYGDNEKFIKDYINGHTNANEVLTEEQKGIIEFLNTSGRAYEAQERLAEGVRNMKKEARDERAFARYSEQWDKTLEKVEARGATSLERLRIQQEGEIRNVKLKAERAKATEEELGRALVAISVKYARLRQEEADKFAPGRKIQHDYEESQKTIEQIAKAGMLSDQEIAQARLDAEGEFLKQKTQLQIDHAVAQKDLMRAVYDPIMEAQVEYDTQLAQLEAYHDAGLVSEENYLNKKHELYTKLLKDQTVAQNSVVMSYMSSVGAIGGAMATILEAAGAKGSKAYKAMFALSKSFSIAQAGLNLATAISQAMADPTALTPAQKFANMAAVATAGAALVTQVSAVGMAHDGIDNIPREGTWLLDKGERVVDRRTNEDLKDFLSNSNSGNGGGNIIYLTQQIYVQGNGDAALQAAVKAGADMGTEQAVNRIQADAMNNGTIYRLTRG